MDEFKNSGINQANAADCQTRRIPLALLALSRGCRRFSHLDERKQLPPPVLLSVASSSSSSSSTTLSPSSTTSPHSSPAASPSPPQQQQQQLFLPQLRFVFAHPLIRSLAVDVTLYALLYIYTVS